MPADRDDRWTCPWCQYDLSGLRVTEELRCPECGGLWVPPEVRPRPRPGLALLLAVTPSALTVAYHILTESLTGPRSQSPEFLGLLLLSVVPCGILAGELAHRPRTTRAWMVSAATGLGLTGMLYAPTVFVCAVLHR
jgi:drug/metabolite transporter (DMT)-like permease